MEKRTDAVPFTFFVSLFIKGLRGYYPGNDRYRGGCFCRFYDNESIAGVRCCGSNVICYPVHDAAPLFSVPSSAYVML